MKYRLILSALIALALSLPSMAEDIDLFLGSPQGNADKPNVLLILDNTANWNTAFENEKAALVDTFEGMDPNAFNVGLMMFGESPNLGYVRAAIRDMAAEDPNGVTYNQLYADMIDSFDVSTGTGDGGNARTLARTFAEAYRYLRGESTVDTSTNAGYAKNVKRDFFQNGVGTTQSRAIYNRPGNAFSTEPDFIYNGPPEQNVCANTYIIYIGNTIPSGNVTKDNTARNTAAKGDLEAAARAFGASPSEVTATITDGYTYTAHQGNYADEWARFMHNEMNVRFYAIDVDPTPHPDYDDSTGQVNGMGNSELIRSLSAGVGGGKYFRVDSQVGGGGQVADAIAGILNEIQAENSVFASVALPASTTGQSLFLNQVFIGMFRPDANGYPRWYGNLKQYEIGIRDSNLGLVDAAGELAISPVTGFVTECARSFWTEEGSDNYWSFSPSGTCPPATEETPSPHNSPDGPHVEKGAQAFMLRGSTLADRKVFTCGQPTNSCTVRTNFKTDNTAITEALLFADDANQRLDLINWAIGEDIYDENGNLVTAEFRPSVHGDVIHSQPVALNYGSDFLPSIVVFYGANDGMLRAVNGNQPNDTVTTDDIDGFEPGKEIWSFMAPEFWGEIKRLALNTETIKFPATGPAAGASGTPKAYGMDGPITAYQGPVGDSLDQKYIYAGMRRGGRALYAFNVTVPDEPALLWKRGCDATECSDDVGGSDSWTDIGQTWSPAKVAYAPGHANPVLIMGGGYDPCEDYDGGSGGANHSCDTSNPGDTGDGIYVIDAFTGNLLQELDTERAVPGGVTIVPVSDDNPNIAFAYATDTGGNIYRISGQDESGNTALIGDTAPSTWIITRIASFGCGESANDSCTANRKFLFGPDVVRDRTNAFQYRILAGTGDREKPVIAYSGTTDVQNYFFSFDDKPLVTDWLADDADGTCGADIICRGRLFELTAITAEPTDAIDPDLKGYVVQLSSTEQVVTDTLVAGNTAIFSTHIPYDPDLEPDADVCKNKLGTATSYNLNYRDGSGRAINVITGGLVPSAEVGLVDICTGDNCYQCSGPDCTEDGECPVGGDCCAGPHCGVCEGPDCERKEICLSGCDESPIDVEEPPGDSDFQQSKGRVYWNVVE